MENKLFFGNYLLKKKLIAEEDILYALKYQSEKTPPFIEAALNMDCLDMKKVYEILTMQTNTDLSFEETALAKGYLTRAQVTEILNEREKVRPHIGEILVNMGTISEDVMVSELKSFRQTMERFVELSDILRGVKMFQSISDMSLEALAIISEKVMCKENERIIYEGERAECFYCVVSGFLRVTKNNPDDWDKEIFIYTLSNNDVFGVSSIYEEEKRAANVTAEKESVLLRFDRKKFLDFLKEHPKAAYHILLFIIQRLVYKLQQTHRELVSERKHAVHPEPSMDDVV
ncbi:Crp/Fnr family transcriptional regulator [Candidatus Magnetominusculus dajiuhuensis]|uniref:Crp/Fnr family transcriptional regulator n=1 Tax=Candidatus Magnetominusculus dajiuhuensis TaxID=3137712 RepID=UPI003B4279CB